MCKQALSYTLPRRCNYACVCLCLSWAACVVRVCWQLLLPQNVVHTLLTHIYICNRLQHSFGRRANNITTLCAYRSAYSLIYTHTPYFKKKNTRIRTHTRRNTSSTVVLIATCISINLRLIQ